MDRKLDLTSLRSFLAFPFENRDATNRFLIGAALYIAGSIIPIVPLIPALGYQYQVMRRVVEGERPGMPDWTDWGRLFMDGLKMLLIGGVYLLPGIFAFSAGMGLYFFSFFGMSMAGNHPSGFMVLAFLASMFLMFVGMISGMVLFLAGWIPLPFATAHAVARDDVLAAFRVRQWWRILKPVRGDFVAAWVVTFGLGAILYTIYMLLYMTIILCLVLPLVMGVMSFYVFLVSSALFAAIYRQGAQAIGEPIGPMTPVPPGEPAAGEMIAVETAAAAGQAQTASGQAQAAPGQAQAAQPGKPPSLSPAAGEMIALDVANATAGDTRGEDLPAAAESVAEAFAPELPAAAAMDPNATTKVDREVLLAGSLPDEPGLTEAPPPASEPGADPNATRRLASEPGQELYHTQFFDLPEDAGDPYAAPPSGTAESFEAPADPGATLRLPPEAEGGGENAPNLS